LFGDQSPELLMVFRDRLDADENLTHFAWRDHGSSLVEFMVQR
jgi:hypothetical protein